MTAYENKATCGRCGSAMVFERGSGTAEPPWPQDWYMYVVHQHDGVTPTEPTPDEPYWRACLFHRSKGGRYPAEAKVIMALDKANRKAVREARQVNKASLGKRDRGSVS